MKRLTELEEAIMAVLEPDCLSVKRYLTRNTPLTERFDLDSTLNEMVAKGLIYRVYVKTGLRGNIKEWAYAINE
jgi:DNA-binding HxlR family transcriptional regulator